MPPVKKGTGSKPTSGDAKPLKRIHGGKKKSSRAKGPIFPGYKCRCVCCPAKPYCKCCLCCCGEHSACFPKDGTTPIKLGLIGCAVVFIFLAAFIGSDMFQLAFHSKLMSTVFKEHGGIKATHENTSVSQKGITYENLPKAKLNTIIKWAFDARLLEIRVNTTPVTVYNALFLNKKSFVF